MSLYSTRKGFFGRTFVAKKTAIIESKSEVTDWALMHTRLKDEDVYAIVEYCLHISKSVPEPKSLNEKVGTTIIEKMVNQLVTTV